MEEVELPGVVAETTAAVEALPTETTVESGRTSRERLQGYRVTEETTAAVEAKQEPDSKTLDLFADIFGGGGGAARPDAPAVAGAAALRGGALGAAKSTGAGPPQDEKLGATLDMGGGSAPRDDSASLSEEEQLQFAIAASLDAASAAGGRAEVAQQGRGALQRAIAASLEDRAGHSGAARRGNEEEEEKLEEVSLAVEVAKADRNHGAEQRVGATRAAAAAIRPKATLVVSDRDSKTRGAVGSAVQGAGGAPLLPEAGCEGERLAAAVEGEEGEEKEKEEGKEEGNEELGKVNLWHSHQLTSAAEVKRADQGQGGRLDRSTPDHAGGAGGAGRTRHEAEVARGEACPLSTRGGTRLVRLVRGRGELRRERSPGAGASGKEEEDEEVRELRRERSPRAGASGKEDEDEGKYEADGDEVCPAARRGSF